MASSANILNEVHTDLYTKRIYFILEYSHFGVFYWKALCINVHVYIKRYKHNLFVSDRSVVIVNVLYFYVTVFNSNGTPWWKCRSDRCHRHHSATYHCCGRCWPLLCLEVSFKNTMSALPFSSSQLKLKYSSSDKNLS